MISGFFFLQTSVPVKEDVDVMASLRGFLDYYLSAALDLVVHSGDKSMFVFLSSLSPSPFLFFLFFLCSLVLSFFQCGQVALRSGGGWWVVGGGWWVMGGRCSVRSLSTALDFVHKEGEGEEQ